MAARALALVPPGSPPRPPEEIAQEKLELEAAQGRVLECLDHDIAGLTSMQARFDLMRRIRTHLNVRMDCMVLGHEIGLTHSELMP